MSNLSEDREHPPLATMSCVRAERRDCEQRMTARARVWKKPELLVLARSRPEETVLCACKTAGTTQVGAYSNGTCRRGGSGNVCSIVGAT